MKKLLKREMNEMTTRINIALAPLREEEPDKNLFDVIVEFALDEYVYGTSGTVSEITDKLVPMPPNLPHGVSDDKLYFIHEDADFETDIILTEEGRVIDEDKAMALKYRIAEVFLPTMRAILMEIRPEAMTVAARDRDYYNWDKALYGKKTADKWKEMRIQTKNEEMAKKTKRHEESPSEKKASYCEPSGQEDSRLHEQRKVGIRGASGLFDI